MSNIYSVLDIIDKSTITTVGYNSSSEISVLKLFDYISYENSNNIIRLNTSGFESVYKNAIHITTIEEIYEIVSKVQNKIIIVDCISQLTSHQVVGNQSVHIDIGNAIIIKQVMETLNDYCRDNNCSIIIGNYLYQSIGTTGGVNSMSGGKSLKYISDLLIYVEDSIMRLEKCRFDDPSKYSDIDISKGILRIENLDKLLD